MKPILLIPFLLVTLLLAKTPKGEVIAQIPEASGITYRKQTDTLIVANDEGSYYTLTTKGKILSKKRLGKYDLEGVVSDEDTLIFAIEDRGLLVVDKKTDKKSVLMIDTNYEGKSIALFNKKSGIEGIAKVGDRLYLAKQSKKRKDSFIAVVQLGTSPLAIVDVIEHHIKDTAGLTYHKGYLYMVSDKEDLLLKYDLDKKKIVQKVHLMKGAWEGIAFDTKNVYLADDNGRIVKYSKKALGL